MPVQDASRRELSEPTLAMIAERFKVLAEPMRLRILHGLWNRERSVGEIMAEVRGTQANVSKHLGILQQAGLVARRREGLRAVYRIADPTVFEICAVVCTSLDGRLGHTRADSGPRREERD